MSLWCRHNWIREGEPAYNPAVNREIKGATYALTERAIHGFTRVKVRCTKCGKLKYVEYVGRIPE